MKEYIGIYDQEYIETYYTKIRAIDKTQAREKFTEYLKTKEDEGMFNTSIFDEEVTILELGNMEVI